MGEQTNERELKPGMGVYDEGGERVGTIRGIDEEGFYVRAAEGVTVLAEQDRSGDRGDAIMWRCWECGEMGQIEDIPEECPSCDAPKEALYYWQED